METIDIVLWIALGVFIGVTAFYITLKLAINILMRKLAHDIESLEEALKEQVDLIPCRVEQHDGVLTIPTNSWHKAQL